MNQNLIIPHLFRTEYTKIVAVLCKTYGLSNIQIAEDFVSDTFLKATETWSLKGVPENPTAWLYTVAKNKAKDTFKRNDLFHDKILPELKTTANHESLELDFSDENIEDSQLQMMFAICNPINPNDAQIVLALRILCGFSPQEIANALLSNTSSINKKLYRAKEKLRSNQINLAFPGEDDLLPRLNNVMTIIYLLFNEGYYSTTTPQTIRKDLCYESMRLLLLLLANKQTNLPSGNALMALFCFHASRFESRTSDNGEILLMHEQDPSNWDNALILKGEEYLNLSAAGTTLTKYHVEAMIARWHADVNADPIEKWPSILQLYNRLLQIEYSPITALQRTYALAKVKGSKVALNEAKKIPLDDYHLYHALLGELQKNTNKSAALEHFTEAIDLSTNEADRKLLQKKFDDLNTK
ncbi:RNA polymerase sigma factor [Crocinitomix catalasitica]|uniref:RNA polymerase sigma factor n=1 Tax=Crocinitomix catalasitica TaxID=184607 RepID=UPI00055E8BEA|nr:sigma-70 family RNA polymerase sigma factor [Crocinitomix catalasitica]